MKRNYLFKGEDNFKDRKNVRKAIFLFDKEKGQFHLEKNSDGEILKREKIGNKILERWVVTSEELLELINVSKGCLKLNEDEKEISTIQEQVDFFISNGISFDFNTFLSFSLLRKAGKIVSFSSNSTLLSYNTNDSFMKSNPDSIYKLIPSPNTNILPFLASNKSTNLLMNAHNKLLTLSFEQL